MRVTRQQALQKHHHHIPSRTCSFLCRVPQESRAHSVLPHLAGSPGFGFSTKRRSEPQGERRAARWLHRCCATATSTSSASLTQCTVTIPYKTAFGEQLKLVGASKSFGDWKAADGYTMQWTAGDVWTAQLSLPAGSYEFKCVVYTDSTTAVRWEDGTTNRKLEVPVEAGGGTITVACTWGRTQDMVPIISYAEAPPASALEDAIKRPRHVLAGSNGTGSEEGMDADADIAGQLSSKDLGTSSAAAESKTEASAAGDVPPGTAAAASSSRPPEAPAALSAAPQLSTLGEASSHKTSGQGSFVSGLLALAGVLAAAALVIEEPQLMEMLGLPNPFGSNPASRSAAKAPALPSSPTATPSSAKPPLASAVAAAPSRPVAPPVLAPTRTTPGGQAVILGAQEDVEDAGRAGTSPDTQA